MIGVSLAAALPSADKAKTDLSFSAGIDISSPSLGQGVDPFLALFQSLLTDWQAPAPTAPVADKKATQESRLDVGVEPTIPSPIEPKAFLSANVERPSLNHPPPIAAAALEVPGTVNRARPPLACPALLESLEPQALRAVQSERPTLAPPALIETLNPIFAPQSTGSEPCATMREPRKSNAYEVGMSPPQSPAQPANAAISEVMRDVRAPSVQSLQSPLIEPITQLRESGRHELHLTIHPPDLGPMHLHLELDGPRLSVHVAVQNDDAKAALEQQREPLRVRFEQMGLALGQFDVRKDGGSHRQQDDGSFLPVGQPGAGLARKPYFRVAKSSGRVDVIA